MFLSFLNYYVRHVFIYIFIIVNYNKILRNDNLINKYTEIYWILLTELYEEVILKGI
jgi:hypothetical protein